MRIWLAAACCCALALSGGCVAIAAAGAGAGAYAYAAGDLEAHLQAPLDSVYEAGLAVMQEMGYAVRASSKDALEASIRAEQADETDVKITLEARGSDATTIAIRIGLFGDEPQSSAILRRIEDRLSRR